MRLTNSDMEISLELLRKLTGIDFDWDKMSSGWRLVRNKGSKDVSPRLTRASMYLWITAYIEGIEYGRITSQNP